MRTATVKEFADQAAKLLRATEPLLITRRGKAVGLYLPLEEAQDLPFDLTKNLQDLSGPLGAGGHGAEGHRGG